MAKAAARTRTLPSAAKRRTMSSSRPNAKKSTHASTTASAKRSPVKPAAAFERDVNRRAVVREFHEAVNLSSTKLRKWLATGESKEVGWSASGTGESVGHHSGRRIIAILEKHRADYTPNDLAHMQKVVGYIRRHLAQNPGGDVEETRWRYSLLNWGHDPLKR